MPLIHHRRALLIAAAALLLASAVPAAAQEEGIALGATPEPVVLQDLDGGSYDLADVMGRKPVLVVFWATWCPVCRVLDPRIAAARERFGEQAEFLVVAVGVSQTPAQIRQHIQRHPPAGRLLWDADGAAVRAFEAPGTGYLVILDGDGRVRYTGTGTEQDIEAALLDALGR